MVRYGKFIVAEPTAGDIGQNTAMVDTGGGPECDRHAVLLLASDNSFGMYRALELATEPFRRVYITGEHALEFLVYCIMAKLYRHYNPRSKYIVRDVIRILCKQVPHDTLINMVKLVKLELQLKISLS